MALRRAYWISDAKARLDGVVYAVGYKHQIDRVFTNPGEETHFFQYRGHDKKGDRDGTAWEWGMEIKALVERLGKMIIAEPETLLIELKPTPFETIKVRIDSERPESGWTPKGYADPDHMWNDIRLRKR